MTPGGASWSTFFAAGVTEKGNMYIAPIAIDNQIGCSGATVFRDGEHGGGIDFIPEGPAANSEENERSYPVLTIYRKEEPYSCPKGKFCGGGHALVLMTPHDGSMIPVFGVDEEVTDGPGLFGFPGTRHSDIIVTNTNLKEMFEKGQIPESVDEIKGERMTLCTREVVGGVRIFDLGDCNGVSQWTMQSSSGMFDPLARDPNLAQKDVVKGKYTREMAEQDFGVVLKDDLSLDEKQTKSTRDKIRKERLERATKWRK
jgi:N-methylhydantoinase B